MVTPITVENEITEAVELCDANGCLNPKAVGWSRQPIIRANLKGWGRNKRFEYWCVTSPGVIAALNVSHSDYRVTLAGFFLDLKTLENITITEVHWLPGNRIPEMPEVSGSGTIIGKGDKIEVSIVPEPDGTRLRLESDRLSIDAFVHEPDSHQSMSVVVPWDHKRFQLTRKSNCLHTDGRVTADGKTYLFSKETAYATLDHGRGRWPYSILWNWASASGRTDGHEIGLQFGGKWTEMTPSTENALKIDGQVFKVSEELEWEYDSSDLMRPWKIRGNGIDLLFTPVFNRHSNFNRLIVLSREDQCFGYFDGTITGPAGKNIKIKKLLGWAEEVHRRW